MEFLYIALFIIVLFSLSQFSLVQKLKDKYYYPITIVSFGVLSYMVLYNKFSVLKLGLLLFMLTATILMRIRKEKTAKKEDVASM